MVFRPIYHYNTNRLIDSKSAAKLPNDTPTTLKLSLNDNQTVLNVHGDLQQSLGINNFLFRFKIISELLTLQGSLNKFLSEKEQVLAQKSSQSEYMALFIENFEQILKLPKQYIMQLADDTYREGVLEAQKTKKLTNSKAGKRYFEISKSLESVRLQLANLDDDIALQEKQINTMKQEYFKTRQEDLAIKINEAVDVMNKNIREYNRLLKDIYAPKVSKQHQDLHTLKSMLNNSSEIKYIDIEDILGYALKSPRDKNLNKIV